MEADMRRTVVIYNESGRPFYISENQEKELFAKGHVTLSALNNRNKIQQAIVLGSCVPGGIPDSRGKIRRLFSQDPDAIFVCVQDVSL